MLIKTPRTVIKPFSTSDLLDLHNLCSSEKVMKFMPPHFSAEAMPDTEKRLDNYLSHHYKYGYSFYKVINLENKFIGRAGFYSIEETEDVELGYSLMENFWGLGLATEIGRSLLQYGFNKLKFKKIIGRSIPGNFNSDNVLLKLGFNYSGIKKSKLAGKEFEWNYFEKCYEN